MGDAERERMVEENRAASWLNAAIAFDPADPKVALGQLPRADAVFALMLRLAHERGTAFVLVTHDESLAAKCDRVLRLTAGRLAN